MQLPRTFWWFVPVFLIWQKFADNPYCFRVARNRRQTLSHVSGRKFVIIIHCADVRASAETDHVVTVCVKTTARPWNIFAAIVCYHAPNVRGVSHIGIIGDDYLPWLNILAA